MDNKKILTIIIFFVLLVIIGFVAYFMSFKPQLLSEQPNGKIFREYFKKISLAKLPYVEKPNISDLTPTDTFDASTDLLCLTSEMKKNLPNQRLSYAIYDKDAREYKIEKEPFRGDLLIDRNNFNCEILTYYRAGNYEYKLYVDDKLVAVLPFMVVNRK